MFEKQGYRGEVKIRELERNGDRPFGHVSNKGRFVLRIEKVPFYNIPDLTNFKLKPFVAHITPKINEADRVERRVTVDEELLKNILYQIENAPKGSLVAAGKIDPLSQMGAGRR